MIATSAIMEALQAWLVNATALEVIFAQQAAPRPSTPYASVRLLSMRAIGLDHRGEVTVGDYVDTGSESLTFADADPDTITRSAGSWVADGFKAADQINVAGTANNNDVFTIAQLTDLIITLDSGDTLTPEVIAGAGVTIGAVLAEHDVIGDRVFTASVNVYGPSAWDSARSAANALKKEAVRDTLRTAGLFPRVVFDLDDLTELLDTDWEARVHFDAQFGVVDEYVDNVGLIEHVEIEETYTDGQTHQRTWQVDAS